MELNFHAIHSAMAEQGLSGLALAKKAGIARTTVCKLFAKEHKTISIVTVGKIAKALGLSPAEIIKE